MKTKEKDTKPSWYREKNFRFINLEQYSNQGILVINTYGLKDENIIYDNIKEYCSREVYTDKSQLKEIFSEKQEKHIKEIFRSGISDLNAGFVFRFVDFTNVICVVVFPEISNPTLDQIVIYQYLVHELLHCAGRVFDYCGIKYPRTLDEAEDEAFCLFYDYLFYKIAGMFEPKYFKPEKIVPKTKKKLTKKK